MTDPVLLHPEEPEEEVGVAAAVLDVRLRLQPTPHLDQARLPHLQGRISLKTCRFKIYRLNP